MNDLARTILALKSEGASIVYGEATAVNTVAIEGVSTAVELPALTPVVAGDYCAVLQQGADRLILGAMGAAGWANLTPGSGWSAGAGQSARYRKAAGLVTVQFHLTPGTSGTAAFTLPVGFRPDEYFDHPATAFNGVHNFASAFVQTTGVTLVSWSAASVTSVSSAFSFAVG